MAGQTLDFFVQEVDRLDQELARQGAEILAFKKRTRTRCPKAWISAAPSRLPRKSGLLQLDREEAVLKDRRTRLVQLYETTGRIEADPAANQTPEQKQLQALRDQLAQALAVLSPQNPRVKMLEAQIAALEKMVAAQVGGGRLPTGAGAVGL